MYQRLSKFFQKFLKPSTIFKIGFNISPMYRRSTSRIISVSDDIKIVKIKIPLSYKNSNYVGSIFGGSLFAAVDPIPMIQLMNILDQNYVVWDKSATIKFKIPAKENVFASFEFTESEIDEIKKQVAEQKEIEWIKTTLITNKEKDKVFCEINKTIYIADKQFYKTKLQKRKSNL